MATRRAATHLLLSLLALLGALFVASTPPTAAAVPPAAAAPPAAVPAATAPATEHGSLPVAPAGVPADAQYHPLVPVRILDTRDGGVAVGAGSVIDVVVAGVGGVPVSGVGAVVLNVTATGATEGGYLTVFPAGSSRPLASNVNFVAGESVPNAVIAKVGAGGKVSVYNSVGATHVVVDVQGWFAETSSSYTPLVPVRILDTRDGGVAVGAGSVIDVVVAGVGGVPVSGVGAVVLNVTATGATEGGYLTVFPAGSSRPLASNVNFVAGESVPNAVIAKVGAGGKVSVYNSVGATHVVVDVQGWFAEGAPQGPVFEGDQYGWRFVPSNMLLAPGESRKGQLVQTDLDGNPTGGSLPAGVTFEMTGYEGNVTIATLGGTAIEVTAGNRIDTAVVAAQIPGAAVAPVMSVTVAKLKGGVVEIDDDDVAFPDPSLPIDFSAGDLLPADTSAAGVGPFTWDQIMARLDAPDTSFNDLELPAVLAAAVRYPIVLRGAAPATGTLVVGSGGSSILGRVVEPVGLPTLVAGGYSLISLELVGPQDVYDDLHYDLTYDDLVAIGAAPAPSSAVPPAPEPSAGPSRRAHSSPRADPVPPPTVPDPNSQTVAAPGSQQTGGGGVSKSQECVSKMLASPQLNASAAQFSPVVSIDFSPTLNAFVQVVDGALIALRFELGGSVTATIGAKAVVQFSGSVTLDCKLADYVQTELYAPGPLAALFSITGDTEQHFRLALTLAGGPKVEPFIGCSLKASVTIGFAYETASGNVDDLGAAAFGPLDCKGELKPSLNLSGDGVGVSAEVTIGAPLVASLGVRAGGKVVGAIGKLISYFGPNFQNAGKMKGFSAEANPQLRLTVENFTNAMSFENAKSASVAEIIGKASVEIEPLHWLLKIFGVAGAENNAFSITLYQETLPILNGYQALNPADGAMTAQVGGEDAPLAPAVYVQEDDQFVLTSPLAPSGGGLSSSLSVPELEWAKMYEQGTGGFLTESTLFDVSVIASTGAQAAYGQTTIKVAKKITASLCDELRAEPRTFVLVGNAPMSFFGAELDLPAWGGKFTIQCVEGKVRWAPDSIAELDFEAATSVEIISTGPKDDQWTITGAPFWLNVDPTTGDMAAAGEPGEEETFQVDLGVNFGASPFCYSPRTATLTVTTSHRGASNLPITEEDPCVLEWVEPTITGPGDVTTNLRTKGRGSDHVSIVQANLPSWLHVSPAGQTDLDDTAGEEVLVPFTFTIDERSPKCAVQLPRSFDLTVHSVTRGSATLKIIDPKVDPLENCGLRFTPNQLTGSGSSTMTLRDDDLAVDETAEWEVDQATLPDWLTATPSSGTIESDVQVPVFFAVLGTPFDPCVGRPQRSATVRATAQVPTGVVSTKAVSGQITITRPAIPPSDCPTTTGGAWGDPHMYSMDGAPFEGQILGEYIYSRTPSGGGDPLELVVRTQPTSGSTGSVAPTSVTAVALTYGGSTVEAYAADGVIDVLVDGEVVELVDDAPLEVFSGLSVVRSGQVVRIDTPSLSVSIDIMFWMTHLLNLQVSAKVGSPLEGLLGSPDGNATNDFIGADGTPYTVTQIQANEPPAFFDFVTSWRLTDQSQSPFTRSYAQLGAPNPGFDPAILAEFGDDVDLALEGSDAICAGGISAQQRYGLALEMSFGLNAEIDRYICHYSVQGTATSGGLPVSGLRVSMDAPGLRSCNSTTGPDGRYVCVLTIDLDEVGAATEPLMPLVVDVQGRWPGLASLAAGGSAVFATKASFNSGPPVETVPLVVDPDSLPRVEVSGVMTRDGVPLAGTRAVGVVAYDAAGAMLGSWYELVEVAVGNGGYSFTRVLPPTATRIALTAVVSDPVFEVFTGEAGDLHLGANPVRFDVVYAVPVVTVAGALTDGAAGLAGPLSVAVTARNAGGSPLSTQYVAVSPDPATGTYSFDLPLPRATATVEASVQVGQYGETFRSAVVPVVDNAAVVDLSGVFAPDAVVVSGDYLNELGAPIGTQSPFGLWFFDADGAFIASRVTMVPASAAAGAYSVSFVAPDGATEAEAYVNAGVQGESFRSARVPITQLTSIDLDVVLNPVRLHVTGALTDGSGTPLSGSVPMDIQFKDSSGMVVTGQVGSVVPDPLTGAYVIDFVGPRNATSAVVRALVGVNGEPRTAEVPALTNGDNEFVFNVGFSPPVVTFTGRMTGVGGAPLVGPIPVYVQGHTENYESVFGQYRYVTPDAEGDYAFTIVMPSSVVTVNAVAEVGSIVDWYRTEEVSVVSGNNTVVLDVDYRPPSVTVSGVLVSAPGVPLAAPFVSGPISIGVTAYNANGDVVKYVQPAVTPGVGGAYSFDVALPRSATSVEVRAYISGENIVQTYAGFAPEVHQDVIFDVVYNPPRLNLSGVARKDGAFATGQVRVEIRRYSSPTTWTDSTQFMTIGANGVYGRNDVLLPAGTIKADVTVRLLGSPNSFAATEDALLPGDMRDVVIDFDDVQTTVTVSGSLLVLGEPAAPGFVYLTAYDAGGAQLAVTEWYKSVTPGVNGEFSDVTFVVPPATARATVYSFLTAAGWDAQFYAANEVPVVTALTDTPAELHADAKGVRVTGTLVDDGNRVALDGDAEDIAFDVVYHTPTIGVGYGKSAYYEPDNSFVLELFVPTDATSVDLTITNAGLMSPTTTITPLLDPITERVWNADVQPLPDTTFIWYGYITDNGVPVTSEPELTFEVIGYEYVDWDTPYTEVWRREFTTVATDTGYFGVGWNDVPANATLIRATVMVDGADDGWSRGYTDLVIGGVNQQQFDIELGTSRLRYSGNTILDGCPAPLVFYREFWSFPSEPALPYDWDTNTWPGGTLAARVLVIPDLTAPYAHDTAAHLPTGNTWVGTVYYDHNSGGTGGGLFGPNSYGEAGADETLHC